MFTFVGKSLNLNGSPRILGLRLLRPIRVKESRRGNHLFRISGASSNTEENGNNSTIQQDTDSKMKQTMADLDAILGNEEEIEPTAEVKSKTKTSTEISKATSDEILSLAEEITEKISKPDETSKETDKEKFVEKMVKIVEDASEGASGTSDGKKLLESLESLLKSVSTEQKADKTADVQKMKDKVFSSDTFWVTEMIQPNDMFGGFRFRGNIRSSSVREAFQKTEMKLKEVFGDKYELFMFEESLTPEQQMEPNPKTKVCVQVVPGETARPPASPNWQPIAAGVLFLFTLATSYILGVSSNVGNIPPEVVQYLSQPEHLNADQFPDFVRDWNPSLFLTSAATIAVSVMFLQLAHELGHRTIAFLKKIKLKGSLVLPSTQLGTLGSVTQLGSLVKTRQDLWDLSFAGLASGGIASLVLLSVGLLISLDPSTPKEFLVPVPSVLLQGSTLIGGVLQTIIGDIAKQKLIFLHPFTIAGWCGLTTTALNTLPVGNLDGGRMMYSSFGKASLNISSIFTYAGLALGLIGSSVALPFGLYILICQRDAEVYIQDQVTPTERTRQYITAVAVAVSVFILLPMGLFDASDPTFGPGGPMF